MNPLDTRFGQLLAQRLRDAINSTITHTMYDGAAFKPDDAAATAMNFALQRGRLKAFHDVLAMCQEVDDEMNGRTRDDA